MRMPLSGVAIALQALALAALPAAAQQLSARPDAAAEAAVPAEPRPAQLVGKILVDFDGRHLGQVLDVVTGPDGAARAVIVHSLPTSPWQGATLALPVESLLLIIPDQPYLPVLPAV